MINKVEFYKLIRDRGLFTVLSNQQVQSIDSILFEAEKQGIEDKRQVAYIMATAYWEAHNPRKPELRLTPMKEFGGEVYLKGKKYYPYFGRGFSQLTHDFNYKKEGKRLGLDLLNNPDLILDIPLAANSHVFNMKTGGYTGKKLADYINENKCDFLNARRIVNGTDRAAEIASIAQKFLSCLT